MNKAQWKEIARLQASAISYWRGQYKREHKAWQNAVERNEQLLNRAAEHASEVEELNAQIELLRNYGQRDDLTVDQGL